MRLRLRGWDTRRPSDAPAVSGAADGRGACTTSVRHRRSTDPSCRHLEPSPIGAAACVRQERASRNRAAHARSGRGPGAKGRTWSPPRGARIGRGSGGRGERPAGALERSRCSGTGCQSWSPAVADIIGARRRGRWRWSPANDADRPASSTAETVMGSPPNRTAEHRAHRAYQRSRITASGSAFALVLPLRPVDAEADRSTTKHPALVRRRRLRRPTGRHGCTQHIAGCRRWSPAESTGDPEPSALLLAEM